MTKKSAKAGSIEADPAALAAAEVAAAEAALRESETTADHWRQTEARLRDSVAPDDAEGRAAIADAMIGIQQADRLIPAARERLESARANYRKLNAAAVLARVSTDSAITREAEKAAIAALEAGLWGARRKAELALAEIHQRRDALASEAREAGVPFDVAAQVISVRTPAGVLRGSGSLIPPTWAGWSPERMVAEAYTSLTGQNMVKTISADKMSIVTLIDDLTDSVSADAAAYGRELLSLVYGVPVGPLIEHDPLDDQAGRWAAIRSIAIDGEMVTVTATVLGRGGGLPKLTEYSDPAPRGAVLVKAATEGRDASVAVEIIDPRRATGSVDLTAVSSAATVAIRAVPLDRLPEATQRTVTGGINTFELMGAATEGDEPGTVAVRWYKCRDGARWPETLPLDVVSEALDGLPVVGVGVVRSVTIGPDGKHILHFTDQEEDARAA